MLGQSQAREKVGRWTGAACSGSFCSSLQPLLNRRAQEFRRLLAIRELEQKRGSRVMDANAVLGPVDPQLGGYAAASILPAFYRWLRRNPLPRSTTRL